MIQVSGPSNLCKSLRKHLFGVIQWICWGWQLIQLSILPLYLRV